MSKFHLPTIVLILALVLVGFWLYHNFVVKQGG